MSNGNETILEIKEWMKHNNFTQHQVAKLSGMKQSAISRILRLKISPSLNTIYRIKSSIGMDTEPEVKEMIKKVQDSFNCVLSDTCNRFKTEGCSENCTLYIER